MKKEDKKKEKNKEKDMVLIFLVLVLIIVSIVVIAVVLINGKNVDTNSEQIKELHDYLSTDNLNNCNGLFTYSDKKIDYSKANAEDMACLAYYKANITDAETETYKPKKKETTCVVDNMTFRVDEENKECVVQKISKKAVEDAYNKIFGKKLDNLESFKIDNFNICYLKDDSYYCGLSESYTYTIGPDSTIYRIINRALEKGNKITIYDYFARINNNTCYSTYAVDTVNSKCTENYKEDVKIDYKFMEKYGVKYKHVFEKDKNGTYHWVSSEPVSKLS